MWSRSRAFCRLLGFASLLGAHPARAQAPEGSLELSWQAPPECPDQARVLAQVEALLGAEGSKASRALAARALVTRAGDGSFDLSLNLSTDNGIEQRNLVGDSCQALVDSLAVMLALQLQPTAETAAKPPPAPARKTPELAPAAEPAAAAQRRPTRLSLGAAGVGDSTALPRFGLGARLELGWQRERWYLELGGSAWLPQEQAVREGHAGRARFGWFTAALTLCHASWGESVRFGPCLAAEAGRLSAKSSAVRLEGSAHELWLAAHAGLAFWVPLGRRFLLHSSLKGVVPLRRPRFVIEGIGEVHQSRAAGAQSALGLAICF